MEENRYQGINELGLALDSARVQMLALVGVALAAAWTLYWFPPNGGSLYPRCIFWMATGWYCPGCGSLRALHELMHGDFIQAVGYNAWLVLALPFAMLFGGWQVYCGIFFDCYVPSRSSMVMIWIFLVIGLAFGVARNLPYPQVSWMAP